MDAATLEFPPLRTAGKFFRCHDRKWFAKGFSYGPFAPNSRNEPLPEPSQVRHDFEQIRALGGNTVRVYFPPPIWLMDEAQAAGLRVFVDVPWEKHRCFFEDFGARKTALQRVSQTARTLGRHPALFAISVVNEIPHDVVRFYGHSRVERFIDELIDEAKQQAADCLTTFVNYPTTEYLAPRACDFCCFNVYLDDPCKLAAYLDRLQHIAGNKPLVLGEYGVDTFRQGEQRQSELLGAHVEQTFRHGLAGSYVFAFTDEWHTGGHDIDDWAFGVTRKDRSEKPATEVLGRLWHRELDVLEPPREKVSVVVCSYNGAATLRECLDSLMRLDYPDYEVILVDDGSEDDTPLIGADYPQVVYIRQSNRGLSVARNVGAENATGDIVAYTDDDCVVDEHWLRYLVQSMADQSVDAIGGPNITPPDDGWIAKCVAASPGNPSHVMLDDHHAEHIPGCNMAFRRDVLLGLGGFDPQFRQAGDDVDICWRMLDAGMQIGFAPGAMVWHHRRATVQAYLKQQKGYGRSEAMVHFKHPGRCGAFGRSSWRGIIYGDGAVGLPLMPETIYHGQFGMAPYQVIYRHNCFGVWSCVMSLEWHLLAAFLLTIATVYGPVALVSGGMWFATIALAVRSASRAPLAGTAPWWCRPLVACLYVMQPIVRGWHRQTHLLRGSILPRSYRHSDAKGLRARIRSVSALEHDLYWESQQSIGRERLLTELLAAASRSNWPGDFDDAWSTFDVKLVGDRWHEVRIRTATEELGWPHRFTRARIRLCPTLFAHATTTAGLMWGAAALASFEWWTPMIVLIPLVTVLVSRIRSRRRCLAAATRLVRDAGDAAELCPLDRNGTVLRRTSSNMSCHDASPHHVAPHPVEAS